MSSSPASVPPPRRARTGLATWTLRLAILLCCALAGAAAIEVYARHRHLDLRRARGTAVGGRQTAASHFQLSPGDWDLPYFPRVFRLDRHTLETAWGTCSLDHPGRTVLVLGDSTTRQATGGGVGTNTPQDEARRTWPALLKGALPPDVQVCVVAEDGYHPSDYVALYQRLGPLLHPDLVLVMLCANDLVDQAQWVGVAQDGWVVVYEMPTRTPVYPPLWQPWLWDHSEAFRFVHWQLAERTGNRYEIPVEERPRVALDSLRGLKEQAPRLVMAYLPMLDDDNEDDLFARRRLADLELGHVQIELAPPWEGLRREPGDLMHLSDQAHARVARQLVPVVAAALPPAAGGAP